MTIGLQVGMDFMSSNHHFLSHVGLSRREKESKEGDRPTYDIPYHFPLTPVHFRSLRSLRLIRVLREHGSYNLGNPCQPLYHGTTGGAGNPCK